MYVSDSQPDFGKVRNSPKDGRLSLQATSDGSGFRLRVS